MMKLLEQNEKLIFTVKRALSSAVSLERCAIYLSDP